MFAYAARGRGPAPDTPARGVRPLEPRSDAGVCGAFGAHAYGQTRAGSYDPALGTTEACVLGLMPMPALIAGGLGACYAPNGERKELSRPTYFWLFRLFGDRIFFLPNYPASTRCRNKSSFARPYIWRFNIFKRLMLPSVGPFDHGSDAAALTAA